jgi:lysophospholipase L1-like esterase
MKIRFRRIAQVLLFWCLGGASMFAAEVSAVVEPAVVRVACVGDSITQGSGAENGKSYPSQLQEMLGSAWEVGNFGVSGRTLLKKGDHPYWIEPANQNALKFKPAVVIIMLGTNDTKPQNWKFEAEFVADYTELVNSFLALESKPRVFVCRPCPVPEPGKYGINEAAIQQEIPRIDALARDLKLGVIDMHAALEGKPQLLPDRVHPNTEGAREMAAAAFHALTGK